MASSSASGGNETHFFRFEGSDGFFSLSTIILSIGVSTAPAAVDIFVDEADGAAAFEFTDPPVMALYASWNGSMFNGWATVSSFLGSVFLVKLGSDFFFGAEKKELSDFAVFTIAVSAFATTSFFTAAVAELEPAVVDVFFAGGIFGAGASVALRFFPESGLDPPSTAHNNETESTRQDK